MSQHHYLGFKSLVGESIRYIAELPGCWLALMGWSAAALKCQPWDTRVPRLYRYSSVKDNQSNLKEAIAYLGMNETFPPEHETPDKAHGLETIPVITIDRSINKSPAAYAQHALSLQGNGTTVSAY